MADMSPLEHADTRAAWSDVSPVSQTWRNSDRKDRDPGKGLSYEQDKIPTCIYIYTCDTIHTEYLHIDIHLQPNMHIHIYIYIHTHTHAYI